MRKGFKLGMASSTASRVAEKGSVRPSELQQNEERKQIN